MDAWKALITHLALGSGREWRMTSDRLLADVGEPAFRARLSELLESGDVPVSFALLDLATRISPDDRLVCALGARAERAYRRIPNHGPADRATGNRCLKALAAYGVRGVPELERLARVIRYPSGRDRAEAALDAIAGAHGVSRQEELTVPDHGLDADGRLERRVGDATALLQLDGARVRLVWRTACGRQKTAPTRLRREQPDAVLAMHGLKRRVRREIRGQSVRLERLLYEARSWSFAAWSVRYAEHPLVASLAWRLIYGKVKSTKTGRARSDSGRCAVGGSRR